MAEADMNVPAIAINNVSFMNRLCFNESLAYSVPLRQGVTLDELLTGSAGAWPWM